MEEVLDITGHGNFKLIPALTGFKVKMEAHLSRFPYEQNVFLMMKFRDSNRLLASFIIEELRKRGLRGIRADNPDWNITRNIYNPIAVLYCCKFGLALFDAPEQNQAYSPNVAYELGMMHYQNKNCLILRHKELTAIPFNLIKDLHESYKSDLEVREIITRWIKSIQADEITSKYDKKVTADLPLVDIINWSVLRPSIRSYLVQNNIVRVSDAVRIDFDDILKQKNVGKAGVKKLVSELVSKGIISNSDYIKKFL